MSAITWDIHKNKKLKTERGISFEEVLVCIENEQVSAVIENPSKNYKHQMAFVVALKGYVYYVPFVQEKESIADICPFFRSNNSYMLPLQSTCM